MSICVNVYTNIHVFMENLSLSKGSLYKTPISCYTNLKTNTNIYIYIYMYIYMYIHKTKSVCNCL